MPWLGLSPPSKPSSPSPFFHPLLPLPSFPSLPPPPPAPTPPRSPRHPFTCPLPPLGSPSSAPPHAVGYSTHAWCDHFATLSAPTPRGHRLFLQRWLPRRPHRHHRRASPPAGVVHLIHGLGDHSGKYTALARALVAAGYAVLAHDAHGHGRSDGLRGHAESVMDYVCDARIAIREGDRRLPEAYAGVPRFLMGHSLGGAVAIHVAKGGKAGEWAGVMLTAPAVQVYPKPLLKIFAPLLATLAPLMPVQKLKFDRKRRRSGSGDAAGGSAGTSGDGSGARRRDPLVHRAPVRARLGYEVLKSCENIMREAGRFCAPVLVAHSREDRVTDSQGSVTFAERVGSRDKTLLLYDGKAHDLLVDGERRRRVVRDVVEWADKRSTIAREEKRAQEEAARAKAKAAEGRRISALKAALSGKKKRKE